jgi:CubicO group peptidase (beta-lactamase class C family)
MQQFSGAVSYYKNGRREFFKYYGQAPDDKHLLAFRIGSLSKPMTATAILSLMEKKKIELDVPINRVLRNLNIPDTVTARNLLNHTSGAVYEFSHDVKTESDFQRAVRGTTWSISGKWVYSNVGYQLLGLAVKEVSKQSLYAYIQKEIFSKLTPPSEANVVQGISIDCGKTSIIKEDPYYDVGSGGVIGTPEAVSQFFVALGENKILSPSTKKVMLEDPGKIGYGSGIYVKIIDGQVVYSHNGSVPGFKSFMMFNEKNELLVVINNIEQFPLVQAQKDAILFLTGKEFQIPVPMARKESSIDSKALIDFVGIYVLDFDANQKVQISYNSQDKYFYILDEGKNRKLTPESHDSFLRVQPVPIRSILSGTGKGDFLN